MDSSLAKLGLPIAVFFIANTLDGATGYEDDAVSPDLLVLRACFAAAIVGQLAALIVIWRRVGARADRGVVRVPRPAAPVAAAKARRSLLEKEIAKAKKAAGAGAVAAAAPQPQPSAPPPGPAFDEISVLEYDSMQLFSVARFFALQLAVSLAVQFVLARSRSSERLLCLYGAIVTPIDFVSKELAQHYLFDRDVDRPFGQAKKAGGDFLSSLLGLPTASAAAESGRAAEDRERDLRERFEARMSRLVGGGAGARPR